MWRHYETNFGACATAFPVRQKSKMASPSHTNKRKNASTYCDVCTAAGKQHVAAMFCIECDKAMCGPHLKAHLNDAAARYHRVPRSNAKGRTEESAFGCIVGWVG